MSLFVTVPTADVDDEADKVFELDILPENKK